MRDPRKYWLFGELITLILIFERMTVWLQSPCTESYIYKFNKPYPPPPHTVYPDDDEHECL